MHGSQRCRRVIKGDKFFAALESLDQVSTKDEFIAWTKGDFQVVLPHGAFMACVGKVVDLGVLSLGTVSADFPLEYLNDGNAAKGHCCTFLMQRWMQSREPQLFDLDRDAAIADVGCLKAFRASGLHNIAAHGLVEVNREHASFVSFHRLPHPPRESQGKVLKLMAAPIHAALLRCVQAQAAGGADARIQRPALTSRENEVLAWICKGKSNSEIAAILSTSAHTVKNQAQAILIKLQVNTRAQAATEAMRQRLVV